MHRIPLLVIRDSSDAGFEQVGRYARSEPFIENHVGNTSYDFSVFNHEVTSYMTLSRPRVVAALSALWNILNPAKWPDKFRPGVQILSDNLDVAAKPVRLEESTSSRGFFAQKSRSWNSLLCTPEDQPSPRLGLRRQFARPGHRLESLVGGNKYSVNKPLTRSG